MSSFLGGNCYSTFSTSGCTHGEGQFLYILTHRVVFPGKEPGWWWSNERSDRVCYGKMIDNDLLVDLAIYRRLVI